jgi:hypothetical protein
MTVVSEGDTCSIMAIYIDICSYEGASMHHQGLFHPFRGLDPSPRDDTKIQEYSSPLYNIA